jgi:hypothetical protein
MRTIPSVTEYSLCSLRWTNRGAFTKKFYREPVLHARVQTGMRRVLLITFLLATAAGAADPQRSNELARAYQDMVTAQRLLADAKQQRDRLAQKPGQETEFFERQRSLEREVALKQWRYDQARERWSALSADPSS